MSGLDGKPEILVPAGRGIRFVVTGHYGECQLIAGNTSWSVFAEAVQAARTTIREIRDVPGQYTRAFVAMRCEAKVIDGIASGTDREIMRFEIYRDRCAIVPTNTGGLDDRQAAAVAASTYDLRFT